MLKEFNAASKEDGQAEGQGQEPVDGLGRVKGSDVDLRVSVQEATTVGHTGQLKGAAAGGGGGQELRWWWRHPKMWPLRRLMLQP